MPVTPAQCYRWAIIGATALLVGLVAVGLSAALRRPADECGPYCQSLIRAHTRALENGRDVARAASVAAETVYVAKREKARSAVSAVPMAMIATTATSDTITFADDSSFAIPHRVALLIVSQRDAIAAQDSALDAADSLLAKFRVERGATDSLHAGLAQENTALREQVRALTPGRLSRGWSAIRTPVTLAAGIALGAYVTSRVR